MKRFLPPVAIEREWLILGYLLYGILATSFIVYGAPSLDATVFPGYAHDVGGCVAVFVIVAIVGGSSDRRYRVEAVGALGIACGLAGYFAAALIVLIGRGIEGEGRVAFTVVVFIVTALMWARGLSLVKRWVFERAARRNGARWTSG